MPGCETKDRVRFRRGDGALRRTAEARADTLRYKAWQSMRLSRKQGHAWTLKELAAVVEVKATALTEYVTGLRLHGYVARLRRSQAGWFLRLAIDTGPQAPRLADNGGLHDPNLGKTLPAAPGSRPRRPTREATDGR